MGVSRPTTYTKGSAVDDKINTSYDKVVLVSDSITDVITVATNVANIIITAAGITNINLVGADIANVSTVAVDIDNGNINAAIAAAISTAADLVATNADVVSTGLDAAATAADLVLTNADQIQTAIDALATAADLVSTNADVVSTGNDLTATNADVVSTGQDLVNTNLDVTYSSEWANKAEDILISADAGGDVADDYSAKHFSNKAAASAAAAALNFSNLLARNKTQNIEPLSQGTSARSGMSSAIYTGDALAKSINTGVDMATGNFGGLVWIKERTDADALNLSGHILTDSVRGANNYLASEVAGAEIADVQTVTAFEATGFAIGTSNLVNEAENYIAWSWQTTKKATGTTNGGKPYTAHYNPDMNFSIVGYEGDGLSGHEIPHHLGTAPELSIIKNRGTADIWLVSSPLLQLGDYLKLNATDAIVNDSFRDILYSDTVVNLVGTSNEINQSAANHIQYNFSSKSGVCKIGKYIGTGATGNYVSTEVDGGDAFKPSFVIIKNLTTAQNWVILDSIRGDAPLYPDLSNVEGSVDWVDFVDNGFTLKAVAAENNELNSEYIFMSFAETSIDATKALTNYDYATTPDTLSIADKTLVSLANGFNANGQVDTQYQFGAGITQSFGVGFESKKLYVYTDKTGVLGTTEVRPLSGITRDDADKYGVVSPSDPTLRTTSKHYDYESDSGVALASGEIAANQSWHAFNKDSNDFIATNDSPWSVAATTTSWLQYKCTEKRILKSWKMRASAADSQLPRLFTIEGSNDGATWTAIDSTYTTTDYVGNGSSIWGNLQSTSTNTTAYLYHRINITANNGDATNTGIGELEFNTIIASDYYLIEEGKMYGANSVAIERMYLGEFRTDSTGDIINTTIVNYSIAEQEVTSMTVHKDLTVYGEANGRQFATAWVNFDGTQNPPLIRDSFNVADVVDLGVGHNKIIFETPMDNIGYICDSSQYIDGIYTLGLGSSYIPTKESLTLRYGGWTGAAAADAAPSDAQNITVVFYGGKKIGGTE